MKDSLDILLKDIKEYLKKAVGNAGCDYWADTNTHVARKGKIASLIVLEDATEIGSITEVISGVEVTYATTTKSYLNVVLNTNTLIVFDNPLSSITLAAGKVIVYYIDI
jgi:hypothetical protein